MTAPQAIECTLGEAHRLATDDVNRWRGHCIESYARLEHEVTETLSAMAKPSGAKASVPHNFGDKVKKLQAAVEPGQPFASASLAKALDNFADHLGRRNMLVHSMGKVAIDSRGQWVWRYRFLPSGKSSSIEVGSFEQAEAFMIEKSLARSVQSLGGQLCALRRKLEAVTK